MTNFYIQGDRHAKRKNVSDPSVEWSECLDYKLNQILISDPFGCPTLEALTASSKTSHVSHTSERNTKLSKGRSNLGAVISLLSLSLDDQTDSSLHTRHKQKSKWLRNYGIFNLRQNKLGDNPMKTELGQNGLHAQSVGERYYTQISHSRLQKTLLTTRIEDTMYWYRRSTLSELFRSWCRVCICGG